MRGPQVAFEPEFVDGLKAIFEDRIPFNRVLGLRLIEVEPGRVSARIDMRPELIGNYVHRRLHGGAISAGLDTVGGLAVLAAGAAHHMDKTPAQRLTLFGGIGTIDLRVDYLRPAVGDSFELHAEVMRLGRRIGSTRMEFLGEGGKLLAAGTGAYVVS